MRELASVSIIQEGRKMIIYVKKRKRKKCVNVFEQYREEVIFYLYGGVSIYTIYEIIAKKMKYPSCYDSFYKWLMKTRLRE